MMTAPPAENASPAKSIPPPQNPPNISLDDPSLYINREISWLEFNGRVLEEARDKLTPSVEKLKFVSIFSSNLDEFFMIRVGGLARALKSNINDRDPSGKTVREQLDMLADKVGVLVKEQYRILREEILPEIKTAGIFVHKLEQLEQAESERLYDYFKGQVFPILTPLAVDAGHPFPFLTNLRLNLMVIFGEASPAEFPRAYAFVEVPGVLPRLVRVNVGEKGNHYILLEDLIRKHISAPSA
jgi:polyphosphate kinase